MSEKLKFQKAVTSTEKAPKKPNYKLRRAVAGTVMAAVGLTGAVKALDVVDANASNHFNKIEQEAIKGSEVGRNAVIVLREGATYRTSPHTVNAGGEEGPDTVAGRVPEGQVLRIDRPIVHVEQGANESQDTTWYGFSLAQEKGGISEGSETNNVFWVNASALGEQTGANGESFIDVYNYANDDRRDFTVGIDGQTGNFLADFGNKGGLAAYGSMMPVEGFDLMAQTEQLTPAK